MAKKVRKQRKKRDFTKIKSVISTVLKVFKKIAIAIVGLASFIAFLVVPFLHNCIDHTLAQWIWYPAVAILVLGSIVGNARNKRQMFKTPLFEFLGKWGEFSAYPIIISIFVFNYYEIDYAWMWVIFGIIALCVPAFFLSLLSFHIKNDHPSAEAKQQSSVNIMKSIILYWFIDLLYMSIFNDWLIPTFIFGILSIVIIFFNLTNAFLNGAKSLRFFIVLEMILALIMSGYLIFIIPNESVQEIVLTIAAALYGGILTLVGVAWTIKKTDEDKKETQQLTLKPWLFLVKGYMTKEEKSKIQKYIFSISGTEQNSPLSLCILKNTDNGIAILRELSTRQYRYIPVGDAIVDKNSVFNLYVSFEEDDKKENLRLMVEDVLGNQYTYKLLATEYPSVINTFMEERNYE